MKQIFNVMANETQVEEVATTKVDAQFVGDLQGIFEKIPSKTRMWFKQTSLGQLKIALRVEFNGVNLNERTEGFCDSDLISAILEAASGNDKPLNEYVSNEHEIEVAGEGENLISEILKQFLSSGIKGTIEPDWISPKGKVFRKATFFPSNNTFVHFSVEATEEINKLLEDACTPEWKKNSETKNQQITA